MLPTHIQDGELCLRLQGNQRFEEFCSPQISAVVDEDEFLRAIASLNATLKAHVPHFAWFLIIPAIPFIIGISFYAQGDDDQGFGKLPNSFKGMICLGFGLVGGIIVATIAYRVVFNRV